jgi:hypothetical protein
LVVQLAKENLSWGYTRIVGSLKNLGITIDRTTVKSILKEHGIEPAPLRSKGMPWSTFIKAHLGEIVAADFFSAVRTHNLEFCVRALDKSGFLLLKGLTFTHEFIQNMNMTPKMKI